MLLAPSAQEIRPSSSGHGFVQGGKEVGIIYETLNVAPLWKLKIVKPISIVKRISRKNNTNRSVYKEIVHDIHIARQCLNDGRVTELELLEQESIITE